MNPAAESVRDSPSVTVIIVSYNTRDWLEKCLQSIPRASQEYETRVVVIDNASSDGSADFVATHHPSLRLLRADTNLGFAKAVNVATTGVATDYLLLLNPDGYLHPHAVDNLITFAEAHPEYVICGGRTLSPSGELDPRSCWAAPSLWSLLCRALMLSSVFPNSRLLSPEEMGGFNRDHVRRVDIVTGCLLLIRTSDWMNLGGFDERFFVYGEDADLCLRASSSGRYCAITPAAVMVHAGGESAHDTPEHHGLVLAGQIALLSARWPAHKARVGRTITILGVALHALVEAVVTRDRAAVWRGVWQRRKSWWNGYPLRREMDET